MNPRVPGASSLAHPDRSDLARWQFVGLVGSVVVASAVAGYLSARGQLEPTGGAASGALVALLAMVGLTSLSIVSLSRTLLFVATAMMVRFGFIGSADALRSQVVLVWVVAAISVLVLSQYIARQKFSSLDDSLDDSKATSRRLSPLQTARTIAAISAIVIVLSLILGPILTPRLAQSTSTGNDAEFPTAENAGRSLQSSESIDMTSRPKLDDTVVLSVDSDRATFWRGETFDTWDGRIWSRSDPAITAVGSDGGVNISQEDIGAFGDDVLRQRVTVEAAFSNVVYAAPSPVSIDIERPVGQRSDGTLVSAPLGEGSSYTVISRRTPLSAQRLREAETGETPEEILAKYAQPAIMTQRVRELAPTIVEGASTRYDQILAIEQWMGERVEYSLDAPLAPKDADVVDHFLFEAEQGWCEQIASSLVVLARANAIPARLVTGYVPGERDPLTGRWIVRAKQAHAWAEVWFPELGWVPFDPTADVPLAGSESSQTPLLAWILDHLVLIVLVGVASGLIIGPVRIWWRKRKDHRSKAARNLEWAARIDQRLIAIGQRWAIPRAASQTATAHSQDLARAIGDPRLETVGLAVDDYLYTQVPMLVEPAHLEAILAEIELIEIPEASAVP
ncbi:MAG: transglutaminase domain-containing protein [Acidimicrobiales bacterium]|nr:transglutaminase domain-containing protein [Acidimicrobiales bacterium]